MKAVLDRFGKVVVPEQVHDDLDLKPGDVLQLDKLDGKLF